jgi:hypothetical protein
VDDLFRDLTGGHVTEVKIVLTSVIAALAFYQVFLMTVGYGKLKLPFLKAQAASFTHRASGDLILTITLLVGVMCLSYFGIEDGIEHARDGQEATVRWHVIFGFLLVGVLGLKIVVLRWWKSMGRFLPLLGLSVFGLFIATWITSAGVYI